MCNWQITQEFECLVKREKSDLLKDLPFWIDKVKKYAKMESASRPKVKQLLETYDSESEVFPSPEGNFTGIATVELY